MKRITVLVSLLLSLMLASAAPVSAWTLTWRAHTGDTSSTSYIYLKPDGVESNNRLTNTSLNNNIESFYVDLPTNRCLALWDNVDYTGTSYAVHGDGPHWYNIPDWFDNRASSWLIGTVTNGVCTNPWYY